MAQKTKMSELSGGLTPCWQLRPSSRRESKKRYMWEEKSSKKSKMTMKAGSPQTCRSCGGELQVAQNTKKHMRIHTERPHLCGLSPNNFMWERVLNTHNGECRH